MKFSEKNRVLRIVAWVVMTAVLLTAVPLTATADPGDTLKYGILHVDGKLIKNSANNTVTLNGVTISEPGRINAATFDILKNDWHADFVRVTQNVDVDSTVSLASARGLYTVIDFSGGSASGASAYLADQAQKHSGNPGVIYAFSGVSSGGQSIVTAIRAKTPNALIIAGTPLSNKRPDQGPSLTGTNLLYAASIDCAESATTAVGYLTAANRPLFIVECKLGSNLLNGLNWRMNTWKDYRQTNSIGGSWGDLGTGQYGLLTGEISYILRAGYRKYKDAAPANPTSGFSPYDLTDAGYFAKSVMSGGFYSPRPIGDTVYQWDFESGLAGWATQYGNSASLGTAESNALAVNWTYTAASEWSWNNVPMFRTTSGAGTNISDVKWLYFDYYLEKSKITEWGLFYITPVIETQNFGQVVCEQVYATMTWGKDVGNGLLKFSCLVHTRDDWAAGNEIKSGSIFGALQMNMSVISNNYYSGNVYVDNIAMLSNISEASPVVPLPLPNTGLPVITIDTGLTDPLISHDVQLQASFDMTNTSKPISVTKNNMTIKARGNSSSTMFPKQGFQIKFEKKQDLLGMGAAKKWVLISNYADKTLMRNEFAYALSAYMGDMPYSVETRNVELILNGEYVGTYMLAEKVEIGSERINIGDNGFLLEFDNHNNEETYVYTSRGLSICIKEPEAKDTTEANLNAIRAYTQQAEDSLYNGTWQNYIDIPSWVDWYLVNELMMNWDFINNSGYFYANSIGEKFYAGPVWDFDGAIGNGDSKFWGGTKPDWVENWVASQQPWLAKLLNDPIFKTAVKKRWTELRLKGLENKINEIVEGYRTELAQAQVLNYTRWNTINLPIWPRTDYSVGSFDGEVTFFKSLLIKRAKWLDLTYYDKNLVPDPVITLTVSGNGTATGAGTYAYGDLAMISATPSAGYIFDGWYENGVKVSASAAYVFQAALSRTLEARFSVKPPLILSGISVSGSQVHGEKMTLTINASGGVSPCKYSFYIFKGGKICYVSEQSPLNSISYAPRTAGTYTVTVCCIDDEGISATKTQTIVIT